MAYSFKYSRRPGTPAATRDGQISEAEMNDRLQLLQALLNEQQQAFNQTTVGRTTRLLLERKGKLEGQLIGKSPWLQSVHVIAPGLKIGDMVDVRIVSAGANSVGAEVLMEEAASCDGRKLSPRRHHPSPSVPFPVRQSWTPVFAGQHPCLRLQVPFP